MATQRGWTAEAQGERVERAMKETFSFTPRREGAWLCASPSGWSYVVSAHRCSCGDYQYRSGRSGGRCKHMLALGAHLIEQSSLPAVPEVPATYRLVHVTDDGRRVLATGLDKAFAERMRDRAKREPRTSGMVVVVEVER